MTASDPPAQTADDLDVERGKAYATVLRIKDVSRELQVSVGRARELVSSGRLPRIPGLDRKTIRVSRQALDAFIKSGANK
ncbi:MAG: helix-turn-helix domain-containing protein [Actinomycetota bacterium]|jgi:hypothetical protein|nr:helix-turn-helix domain-containing protein [Actinomycetota bacterium]